MSASTLNFFQGMDLCKLKKTAISVFFGNDEEYQKQLKLCKVANQDKQQKNKVQGQQNVEK